MRTFTIAAAVLGLALLSGTADAKVKLKVACGAEECPASPGLSAAKNR